MTDSDNQEKVKKLISAIEDYVDRYRRIEKDLAQLKPVYDKDGDAVSCDASILDDKSAQWVQDDIAFFNKRYCGSFDKRYQSHCKHSPDFLKIFILQLRKDYIKQCLESLKFFLYCELSHFSQDDIDNKIYILDRDIRKVGTAGRSIGIVLKDHGRFNKRLHKELMKFFLSPQQREMREKAAIKIYRTIDDLSLRKLAGLDGQAAEGNNHDDDVIDWSRSEDKQKVCKHIKTSWIKQRKPLKAKVIREALKHFNLPEDYYDRVRKECRDRNIWA